MLKMSAAVNDIKAESFSKASYGLFMLQFNRKSDYTPIHMLAM